jgi:hypothetical protein
MEFTQLLTDIRDKAIEKKTIARQVAEKPPLIADFITALADKDAAVRYGCAKTLHLLSETRPDLLYPHFDDFLHLLRNGNNIMQAEGLFILSNLAPVDSENRIDAVIEDYLGPIKGPVLMVAANAVQGAARIAAAKPHLANRIAQAILEVSEGSYKTPECKQVIGGQAVEALDAITHLVTDLRPLRKFIRAQTESSRKSTRTKAEKVLKRRGW